MAGKNLKFINARNADMKDLSSATAKGIAQIVRSVKRGFIDVMERMKDKIIPLCASHTRREIVEIVRCSRNHPYQVCREAGIIIKKEWESKKHESRKWKELKEWREKYGTIRPNYAEDIDRERHLYVMQRYEIWRKEHEQELSTEQN